MKLATETGYQLVYILSAETWYAQTGHNAEINVVKRAKEGGCAWEFGIVEHRSVRSIRIEVFADAFAAFAEVAPLFEMIAPSGANTLAEAREILDELGFADATERVRDCR